MSNGQDKLQTLYTNLVKEGYDLPEYEQFKVDMTDEGKATRLHASLVSEGYDLPDFGTFQMDMGLKKKEPTGDVSKTGTEPTSPSKSPSPLPYTEVKKKTSEFDKQIKSLEGSIKSKYGDIEGEIDALNKNYESVYAEMQRLVDEGKKSPEEANAELKKLSDEMSGKYANYKKDNDALNAIINQRNQFVKNNPLIDFQAMVAGVKPPTSQVDIELQETSRVPSKIEPQMSLTPPVEKEEVVDEFAQQGEVMPMTPPEQEVEEDTTSAIGVAKKKFPDPIPEQEQMLSEELEQIGKEIQGIGIQMTFGEQLAQMPEDSPEIEKIPKFKAGAEFDIPNPDYYATDNMNGGASPWEQLAYKGFYQGTPEEKALFATLGDDIAEYLEVIETTEKGRFQQIKERIESGKLREEDRLGVVATVKSIQAQKDFRDIRIAEYRQQNGEGDYEGYIDQKIDAYNTNVEEIKNLYKLYPEVQKEVLNQETMNMWYKQAKQSGDIFMMFDALTSTAGKKGLETIEKTLIALPLLTARIGSNFSETARSVSYDLEDFSNYITPTIPETDPLYKVKTPTGDEWRVDPMDLAVEVAAQGFQMFFLYGKGAQATQGALQKIAGQNISKNAGLFTVGFLSTYDDLYQEALDAGLSPSDANTFSIATSSLVAAGELISPNEPILNGKLGDFLEAAVRLHKGGSTGKAFQQAFYNYAGDVIKENGQELFQTTIENAAKITTDATVNGSEFGAELFNKDEIYSTILITTLSTTLARTKTSVKELNSAKNGLYLLAENYETFSNELPNLVEGKVLTQQEATRLDTRVKAVIEAKKKVPQDMPEKKKADVVPLVAEKDELEAQKKELDPIFQPPIDKKIQEVEEEILAIYEQKAEMESPTIKPEVVAEQGEEVKVTEEKVVLDETVKTKEPVLEGVRDGGNETQVGEEGTQLRPQEKIQAEEVKAEKEVVKEPPVQKELTPEQQAETETSRRNQLEDGGQVEEEVIKRPNDFGYHGGTLSGKSDYLAIGYAGEQPFTGHYFFSDEGRAKSRGDRAKENDSSVMAVDFTKYNLLKPTTPEYWVLKNELKKVKNNLQDKKSIDAQVKRISDFSPEVGRWLSENKDALPDLFKQWEETRKANFESGDFEKSKTERFETFLLKNMGYEGIDVRGLKEEMGEASPDSSSEGSVIFDLKEGTVFDISKKSEKKTEEAKPKPTPEQQARAESFGFNNPYNLIQSIKKQTGKEYTLEEFDNIPDEEIRKAAEGSETVKGKKIKEASKKLADTIRKGKIAKPDIFSAQTPASLVWDAALETIASTIEAGGTVAQAVSDGLTAIKNSDWYKGLTPDKKAQAEIAFNDWASENVKEPEPVKEAPTKKSEKKAQEGAVEVKNDFYENNNDETFPEDAAETGSIARVKSVIDAYANRSNFSKEMKDGLRDFIGLYYTQLSNTEVFKLGEAIIQELGLDAAVNEALTSADMAPVMRTMIIGSAINEYKKLERKAKGEEKTALSDKQIELADKLDQLSRDYGRAIQLLRPLYEISGVALKRKIEKIIEKRNGAKKEAAEKATKEVSETIEDKSVKDEDIEAASEVDLDALMDKLKEQEKRIKELEKEPKTPTKKTYTRTVSKEDFNKALRALSGKAYSFPAIDPAIFEHLKTVSKYVLEGLIVNGQAGYRNFSDLLSKKLKGKYKDAYKEIYKEITKDIDGVEFSSEKEIDDVISQQTYFEQMRNIAKNADKGAVAILKAAGFTKTDSNGKERIDWQAIITNKSSVDAAIQSLRDKLSELPLTKRQVDSLVEIAKVRLEAAVAVRKQQEIDKIIERYEKNNIAKMLRKRNRKNKIQKLVELSRSGALNNDKVREIISEELGVLTLTDDVVQKIQELQEKLERAPKGFLSAKIEEQITFITSEYKLNFWWDVMRERYFMRMLSGFSTAIKNASGAGVAITRLGITLARTKGNKNAFRAARNQMREAAAVAIQVFKNGGVDKGIAFLDYTNQASGIPRVRYAEYFDHKKYFVFKGKYNPLRPIFGKEKYIGRVLGATDAYVQTISSGLKQYQYEYAKIARREPNLKSSEIAQKAYDTVYAIPLDEAMVTAQKELEAFGEPFNDYDVKRRAYEIIERMRDPKTVERGETVAQQDAFKASDGIGIMNLINGGLGAVKTFLSNLDKQGPLENTPVGSAIRGTSQVIADSIIPFVGGVSNVIEKSLELNPVYGIPKAALNYIVGRSKRDTDLDQAEFLEDKAIDLVYRSAIGLSYFGLTMLLMELSRMSAPDDDEESYTGIFGSGSERYTENEVVKLMRKKNTIRLFGRDIGLDYLGTTGLGLKLYAMALDLERYDSDFKQGWNKENFMEGLTTLVVDGVLKDSFFESLGRFSGVVSKPTSESSQKYMEAQAANLITTYLIPWTNMIRQSGQVVNPQAKTAISFKEQLLKYSGLTAGYGLRPSFDYRGREYDLGDIYVGSSDGLTKMLFGSKFKSDEIDKFLIANGIGVTTRPRTESNPENNKLLIYNKDGSSRPMTEEEYYDYKKLKANRLNELLEKNFSRLERKRESLDRETSQTKIDEKMQSYFSAEFNSPASEYALEEINKKFGDLRTYRRGKRK